jgi:RND family efflux transporter MFP subunit
MGHRSFGGPSAAALLLGVGLVGFLGSGPSPAAEPAEVLVSQPVSREVTDAEDFTGRLEAAAEAEIRSRASGYLLKVHFKAGSEVKQGDLLFEIDPRPAEAALNRTQAELGLAQARLKRVEADFRRALKLLANRAISQEDVDKLTHDRDEARAQVAVAQAGVEAARLEVEFTKVRAPFSGRIGLPLVTPGNLVLADKGTVLARLVSLDPMHVAFDLDERTFLRFRRRQRAPKGDGEQTPIRVGLADEEGFPHAGVLSAIDVTFNASTGTIRARGVLANADRFLAPGMFVRVRLPLGPPHKALLVSEEAVLRVGGKKYLLVVNAKHVVEQREVKLGAPHGRVRVVEEGLKGDEWVVVGGLQRVSPGDTVKPSRTTMPGLPRGKE